MDTRRLKVNIVYGTLLGACIGLLDGMAGLIAWMMLGKPDFFIRHGRESAPVYLAVIGGAVAGVVYGLFLTAISLLRHKELRYASIFLCSTTVAGPLFSVTYYWVIRDQVPLTHVLFIPQQLMFGLAVVLAILLRKPAAKLQ